MRVCCAVVCFATNIYRVCAGGGVDSTAAEPTGNVFRARAVQCDGRWKSARVLCSGTQLPEKPRKHRRASFICVYICGMCSWLHDARVLSQKICVHILCANIMTSTKHTHIERNMYHRHNSAYIVDCTLWLHSPSHSDLVVFKSRAWKWDVFQVKPMYF